MFTFDISASSSDYISKNEIITLDSTKSEENFVITILDNDVVEDTESFGVNVTTDEVFIRDKTIAITIMDEDRKFPGGCIKTVYLRTRNWSPVADHISLNCLKASQKPSLMSYKLFSLLRPIH